MKKCILISLLIIIVLTGCSNSGDTDQNPGQINKENITEEQIVSLQLPVVEFIQKEKVFGISGCYSQHDESSGLMTMYITANEEPGVDYDAYKEKIWENVGAEFNIVFELVPFPDTPTSEGVIRAIEYNESDSLEEPLCTILVVSQTNYFTAVNGGIVYNADYIKIYDGDPINSSDGKEMTYEDLQIGMYVDSYYRGVTPAIYPGQQGTEKLVIYQDFKRPMAGDTLSETIMSKIFNDEDMTGPYPIVLKGYSRLFVEGDIRLWAHLDAGGMVYYNDPDTLEEPGVFIGPLLIHYENESSANIDDMIPDVVLKAGEDITFSSEGDTIVFEITVIENDSLQTVKYKIDKKGQLKKAN